MTLGLTRACQVGADVENATRAAREARRAAVLEAQAEGLTLREIAAELGVCHQRVHQIITTPKENAR